MKYMSAEALVQFAHEAQQALQVFAPTGCLSWGPAMQAFARTQGLKIKGDRAKCGSFLERYELHEAIEFGAFGVIHACTCKETGHARVVKVTAPPAAERQHEAKMLRLSAHRSCVVRLHEVFYDGPSVLLVLDRHAGGDLLEGMQRHWATQGQVPLAAVRRLAKQLVACVGWLHRNQIAHRDVKGANFLLDREAIAHPSCRAVLTDFGTAVGLRPKQRLQQQRGTEEYWAPEVYGRDYGLPADVWAVGVVLFGLACGRKPFEGEVEIKTKPLERAASSAEEQALLRGLLERDEPRRLTACAASKHPFVEEGEL